jgi:hypothetical protein
MIQRTVIGIIVAFLSTFAGYLQAQPKDQPVDVNSVHPDDQSSTSANSRLFEEIVNVVTIENASDAPVRVNNNETRGVRV